MIMCVNAPMSGRKARALTGHVRRWRPGYRLLATTPAGVEIAALAVFLGVRAVGLVQLAVTLPTALRQATSVSLFLTVLACYLAETALLAVVTVRARGYRDARLGWLDTAVAALVLLTQPGFIAHADTTGTWTAWGFALTLGSAAGAAIVFTRRWQATLAVTVLAGCYLATNLPGTVEARMRTTVISNTVAYVGFAVLTWLLVGYLRRLGADAEHARQTAARSAAETARLREVERQRLLLHDNIGVLRMLGRTDLPTELVDPLRRQAAELANRVRQFLDDASRTALDDPPEVIGQPVDDPDGPVALTAVVCRAAHGFGDLPLEVSIDLAASVLLAPDVAETVRNALTTLLANVRLHAAADQVVVHGDTDLAARQWEITVRDNGRGFDLGSTPRGFGLLVQVEGALARHGISAHIHSVPRDGTSVTLRGPLEDT